MHDSERLDYCVSAIKTVRDILAAVQRTCDLAATDSAIDEMRGQLDDIVSVAAVNRWHEQIDAEDPEMQQQRRYDAEHERAAKNRRVA